ncbi:MAG TPA: MBL fold metallo-hydrolase [Tepidisphaeraceae bacterium]|jgi:phosphoribosyl 1,2-cyclic phosphodiesterase|nr:MBL fold metallo-hydrolase [Tepidisphaeraceae bacterium]
MSLELCILASGSSGNAALLRTPAGSLLIDAGIGPRVCAKRLIGTGVSIPDLRAIVLTHLDSDHFTLSWLPTLLKYNLRLHAFTPYARKILFRAAGEPSAHLPQSAIRDAISPFHATPFSPLPGIIFKPLPFSHDDTGSHGFLISSDTTRIGYATDLGRVPSHLFDAFTNLDILAIESNYDPAMQLASDRPAFLKHRIMSGSGHLSNQQALDTIRLILSRHESTATPLPSHIVLLHRSRECNCPNLLRDLFSKDPRIAPRLTLSHQSERTTWLLPQPRPPLPHEQLPFAFA